jgi:peptidoglycan/xylan/chitin deacetylase (PgdA/CDA1 family)
MAENDFLLRLPGDDVIVRRRRRGFGAFCALMAFAIAALAITSFRPGSAQAGRAEGRTAILGRHGSPGEDPVSDGGAGGIVSGGAGALVGNSGGGTAESLQRLVDAGQPIYCGARTKPLVALTFDDGPGPDTLHTIEALKAAGMTATFFEVGKLLGEPMFDGIPKAAARFGAIGDHTWDHISMVGLSRAELDAEITRTRRVLQQITGQRVFLFRPPLGQRDATVDAYVRSAGMLQIMWTIDSGDSMGASDDQIYRTVRDRLSPGDIVLLHENRGTTQNALPRIIQLIQRKGYRAVTIPQLLAMDPPTAEQLRHHTCS